ncbi:MAG TPA: hypothetical protein VNT60_08760 [Deinococcales bacterium]|nr:hypothetical protein [Deinococcales bacterium]
MKHLTAIAAVLLAGTAAAQVTIRVTPPTPPSVTITTAPPPVTQVVVSANLTLRLPATLVVSSQTRSTDATVVYVRPASINVVPAQPVYITAARSYESDLQARGYTLVSRKTTGVLVRLEYRRHTERVIITSSKHNKGAQVRIQAVGKAVGKAAAPGQTKKR